MRRKKSGKGVILEIPFGRCGKVKSNKCKGSIKRASVQRAFHTRKFRTILRAKSMLSEHAGSRDRHVQR